MNNWFPLIKLFSYFLIASVIITAISKLLVSKGFGKPNKLNMPVALLQNFVGSLFIFSGFIKAIDPIGTAIKMQQYFDVFDDYHIPMMKTFSEIALSFSVFMIVLEIVLGILLIKGLWPKTTIILLLLTTIFFTFLTGFTAYTGKVTDCGCFGDFLKLKPYVSFGKDLILLIVITPLLFRYKEIVTYPQGKWALITASLATILSFVFCLQNTSWDEPMVDFRPFYIGQNIPKAIEECNKDHDIIQSIYTYKDSISGKSVTINSDDLIKDENKYLWDSASTWKVDKDNIKEIVLHEGCHSKVIELKMINHVSDTIPDIDMTDSILTSKDYVFLVIAPHLSKTSNEAFKTKINPLAAAVEKDGKKLYTICGDSNEEIERFRHEFQCSYPFFVCDEVVLKTIMRSNPGIILMKDGIIVNKWHWRKLPEYNAIKSANMK